MRDIFKGKFVTALVVIATVILAGVAIFTAVRLYQLRNQPVAPTAPTSEPGATGNTIACTSLAFTLTENTPTPTVTGTVTPTSSPTLTPTSTLTTTPSPTLPPGVSATPTNPPSATSTATPTPTTSGGIAAISPTPGGAALPDAGVNTPTLLA